MLNQKLIHTISDLSTATLRLFPAEFAHDAGIKILKSGVQSLLPRPKYQPQLDLSMKVDGLGEFSHPLALAAGLDKNGVAVQGLSKLGFAAIEIGTVTPRPQAGNPKPRLFRLKDQSAIINRMGFNNHGVEAMKRTLKKAQHTANGICLGINLGKNKDTPLDSAIDDYLNGINELGEFGSYYVINISSPNTPGLRDLASQEFLKSLATEISAKDADMIKKVWVKVDPDLKKEHFQEVVSTVHQCGFAGIILTNTHRVESPEMGGLSGHPISVMSALRLEWAYEVTQGALPMIGVGGVLSGGDVYQKVIRGASLVQIYTALIYRGPWAVQKILEELEWELKLNGFNSLQEAFGTFYK